MKKLQDRFYTEKMTDEHEQRKTNGFQNNKHMGGMVKGVSEIGIRTQKREKVFLRAESRGASRNTYCSADGSILEEQSDDKMVCN